MSRTTSSDKITILIAHHDAMSRELMGNAFRRRNGFQIVAQTSTFADTVSAAADCHPDVCLLNARLAEGPLSGFIALRQMHRSSDRPRVVMLLDSPEKHLVVDSFRGGARGVFCPSLSHFDMLCKCTHSVHTGQIWATSEQLGHLIEEFASFVPLKISHGDPRKALTTREEDVLSLVANGLTNRAVARRLGLSEHTVKNYLFHIFDKIGVTSRVELVLYAMHRGIPDAVLPQPDRAFDPHRRDLAVATSSEAQWDLATADR